KMTAYNVVRFLVKPGTEKEFENAHRDVPPIAGAIKADLFKTGDRTYCFVGEWKSQADLIAARPKMIANLDRVRPILEDLGNGLGVTDPVSGETVVKIFG
ncbi:MAG: DUF718 domain-containing protein, partial [Bdellovibrionia bacterium]